MAQSTCDNNALQASQYYYEGMQYPYDMNEPGLYSETQESSSHRDLNPYDANELGLYIETQGSSSHLDPIGFDPYYRGTLEGFEYFTGLQSHDHEQSIAHPTPTRPPLLPFPILEPIIPQFNPPSVPPPPGETSVNSYVNDRVVSAHALIRPGEAVRGQSFEVIHVRIYFVFEILYLNLFFR
jgi:hypothetical protein